MKDVVLDQSKTLAKIEATVMGHLYIGKVSKQTGLNPRTIRYYEGLGLLPPPLRSESRYRLYTPDTVELLRFIKKAKTLGFTLTEIREIIALRQRGDLPCPHVHALLTERVQTLSRQIRDLTLLRDELKGLARRSASLPWSAPTSNGLRPSPAVSPLTAAKKVLDSSLDWKV